MMTTGHMGASLVDAMVVVGAPPDVATAARFAAHPAETQS